MMTRRGVPAIAVAALLLVLVSGCVETPTIQTEPGQNYVSGDGAVTEFSIDNRGDPIEFAGMTDQRTPVTSDQYRGEILVVNFWYASCPPCRLEAPWLEELSQQYAAEGVQFLGVNIRDGAETSRAFAAKFVITYPSIIDTDGQVALAFAGQASPAAVPTTLVLDREGKVASRIVGLIEKSTLDSLIRTAVDEVADE